MLNRREFLKVGLTSIFGVLGASHIKVEPDSIPVEVTNTNTEVNDGKWHVIIKNPSGMTIDLDADNFRLDTKFIDLNPDWATHTAKQGDTYNISPLAPGKREWVLTVEGTNGLITQELFDNLE